MVQAAPTDTASAVVAAPIECVILTRSGTVVARGRAAPRRPNHLAQAYAVRLSDIEPRGALEAMVYADQPRIILRMPDQPGLPVRIDHMTGAADHREFYCHLDRPA